MVSTGGNLSTRFQLNCCLWSFSRREVELHIFIGSRLRALGCEQNQSFRHLGVMFGRTEHSLVIDVIWIFDLDIVITIGLNQFFNRSVKKSNTS